MTLQRIIWFICWKDQNLNAKNKLENNFKKKVRPNKDAIPVSTLDSNRCQETQITRCLAGKATGFIFSEQKLKRSHSLARRVVHLWVFSFF